MSNDYLWDGQGEPDPGVERLERALAPLRYKGSAPVVLRPRRRSYAAVYGLAALAAAVALFLVQRLHRPLLAPRDASSAAVVALAGAPRLDARRLAADAALAVGTWLETDSSARARIDLPKLGTVEVSPGSRIRLVAASAQQQRLELQHGTIVARMVAPPRLFIIDTPAAAAVDLGCAYRLEVDPQGDGRIWVTSGYVSLEAAGRSSLVPAGAAAEMRKARGPGTPYFVDSAERLKPALLRLDFGGPDAAALSEVLQGAREHDTLTLWHLLARVSASDRPLVFARLDALSKLPPELHQEDILKLAPEALAAWQEALAQSW